jgi:lipopolysaccharide transport system ATP-binding protein
MSDIAIRVEKLAKQYRLGARQASYKTLRESVMSTLSAPFRRTTSRNKETVWALQDVSFEVKRGEVIGIIGRNGAGKSTLLKILARITEPTRGYADIHGRIGSLLEVGSGFHPELSGRENIFLNGAILGMKRAEITRKFDEIVAFAEVERFIDTQVKHYSSGMHLRLAFAVAAHLEPEILLLDEVLAVGDFDFQKKCLGKMKDVAGQGRTVVFVSHNMGAVQHLCDRAILLNNGKILLDSSVATTVSEYLNIGINKAGERIWQDRNTAPGFENMVRLVAIRVRDAGGAIRAIFDVKEEVIVEVEYEVLHYKYSLNVHLYLRNETGQTLFVTMDNLDSPWNAAIHPVGVYQARCTIPANFLNEGGIRVEHLICTRPTRNLFISVPDAIAFQMKDDRDPKGVRGNWTRDWPSAMVRPRVPWQIRKL